MEVSGHRTACPGFLDGEGKSKVDHTLPPGPRHVREDAPWGSCEGRWGAEAGAPPGSQGGCAILSPSLLRTSSLEAKAEDLSPGVGSGPPLAGRVEDVL